MKKSIFVAGLAVTMAVAASAQDVRKDEPPKPPVPPKPMVKKMKDVPPPPDAPPPPPPPAIGDIPLPQDVDEFMKRNQNVKGVDWKADEIIIQLKSGNKERYNLNDAQSKKSAEAKYGALPEMPPPPPPPPAAPKAPKKKNTLS